jgi:NitT/TauT family transport system ATP-binding protein
VDAAAQDAHLVLRRAAPTLVAEDIHLVYRDGNVPTKALEGVNLRVANGEFLCILGPSGCGKTSLLRVLSGLVRPTQGRVYLDNELLTRPSRRVGLVFQAANLMPWRTVLRNVTLPLEVAGIPLAEAERRARALLDLVGLAGFEQAHPAQLSGGMQQRVAIARALVQDPVVLLMDEPFGALDALTRERLSLEFLRIWSTRRQTVVMVTHDIQEAIFLADRVLVLSPRPGRVVLEMAVPLPRPRTLDVLYTSEFAALAREARGAIAQA